MFFKVKTQSFSDPGPVFHTIVSIKNDGHYFCGAGRNRPDGFNEPVTLNAELTDHLGHEKNAPKKGSNTRNGYSSKTLLSDDGEIELNTPRDRENTF